MAESDVFGEDDEIRSQRLLEDGLYPESLPPNFEIRDFWSSVSDLVAGGYVSAKPTEPTTFNATKRGGSRRMFGIPNPTFAIDAARFYSNHKTEIYEHFNTTDYSSSVPKFNKAGRPLRITSQNEYHRARRKALAVSRYVVKTDISRYFHSIYTHSIPWALNGKSNSKSDRKAESAVVWGNRLDHIYRQSRDGQTIGIHVGPDFSRYTSEIIGKSIDLKFRQLHGGDVPYMRNVDDIFIGADNADDANQCLTAIRAAVREFELDLNDAKTAIVPTNSDLEPFWPVRIRRELAQYDGSLSRSQQEDFVYFLDDIIHTANLEKDDGVVKFSLRQMDQRGFWGGAWEVVEPFLVRCAVNFPHCWDYVASIVAWRHYFEGINVALWAKVIGKSLAMHARVGHDFEICWALWLAKQIGASIAQPEVDTIVKKCGALPVLTLLDMSSKPEHSISFPRTDLLDRLGDRPMSGADWVLAFEADRQFGMKIKTKNLGLGTVAEALYDGEATFYNPSGGGFAEYMDEDGDDENRPAALVRLSYSYDEDEGSEEGEVDTTGFEDIL